MKGVSLIGLITTVILLIASSIGSANQDADPISVDTNRAVIQVKGVVCSFCAFGAEKNLSKLSFLDESQYGDGVLIDIHTHRITLAIQPGKKLNLQAVYEAIKAGGYDPVKAYVNMQGKVNKSGNRYLLTSTDDGQIFQLIGSQLEDLVNKDSVNVTGQIIGDAITKLKDGEPIPIHITSTKLAI